LRRLGYQSSKDVGIISLIRLFYVVSNMSYRNDVIAAAASQIGVNNRDAYFQSALRMPYNPKISWCGIFTLWCLHEAGLGTNVMWKIGRGYVFRLPTTKDPHPGDIAVFQHFWHHALVETIETDDAGKLVGFTTIDGNHGNPPGEVAHVKGRKLPQAGLTFYSIEPLIATAGA
jgi:hypothetical protein